MGLKRPVKAPVSAFFAATLLLGGVAACSAENSAGGGGGGGSSAKQSSYSLGAALPLSGAAASLGQFFEQGIATGVKQVNADGGIDGAKLNVYYQDNQLQAAASVAAMNELTSVHHAAAVIMTSSAGVTATAPIATRTNVLMMNPGGEDPTLQKLSPNLISNIPNVKTEVQVMLPYLWSKGYRRMAMYAEGDALGATTTAVVKQVWTSLGGTFTGAEQEPISVVDHSSVIAKIKAQKPDVLYVLAGGDQAGTFIKQARQEGLNTQIAAASPLQSGDVVELAGAAANGILDSDVQQPLLASNPQAVAYQKAFASLYPGKSPSNIYSVLGHDAVLIYAQAAKYLITNKMPYNGANLAKAILKVKTFAVAGGSTTFLSDGSSVSDIALTKVTNGKFVTFQTVKPSS